MNSFYITIGIAFFIGLISFLVWYSLKIEKKTPIEQLAGILRLLGMENEVEKIVYQIDARWKGQLFNKEIELQYFVNNKVYNNYLYIKTPYKTKLNFLIKNTEYLPFHKNSFLQSNEICLNYIKGNTLRNQLIELIKDPRFRNIRTRLNHYESKFIDIPKYSENGQIINNYGAKETDVLSIMLAHPNNLDQRTDENDFDTQFLHTMYNLLHDIKAELKYK